MVDDDEKRTLARVAESAEAELTLGLSQAASDAVHIVLAIRADRVAAEWWTRHTHHVSVAE